MAQKEEGYKNIEDDYSKPRGGVCYPIELDEITKRIEEFKPTKDARV